MSHHSDTPFGTPVPEEGPEFQKRQALMRDLLDTTGFRGATGEFPQGKLVPHDEGAIQFAIGEKDGKVVIDFGTSVHWFAMTPQEAADLASVLLKRARLVARQNGQSVAISL